MAKRYLLAVDDREGAAGGKVKVTYVRFETEWISNAEFESRRFLLLSPDSPEGRLLIRAITAPPGE